MARKKFSTLTEPMFYLLMSLRSGKKCGIDISEYISRRSSERVKLGPARCMRCFRSLSRRDL